jgi:probable HAF family extracellular repeat protein
LQSGVCSKATDIDASYASLHQSDDLNQDWHREARFEEAAMKGALLLLVLIEGACLLNACGGNNGNTPPATHFAVTAPASAETGSVFSFTVTALDETNNVATGYSGTVRFTSTDGKAVLPGNIALGGGMGMFSATLETAGPQTITVTDMVKTMITGTSSSISSFVGLTITSGPPPPGTVGVAYGMSQGCSYRVAHIVFELKANGGKPPYSWSGSSQAPGLNVTYQSFAGLPPVCSGFTIPVIEGTPTAAGSYNLTVTVTDSGSPAAHASASYTIIINAAQAADNATADHAMHHTYKLIDVGTLGGPQSAFASPASVPVNLRGIGIAQADTPIPDPYSPNCLGQDCFVAHAAAWQNGILADLGALPGVNTSFPFAINDLGGAIGISENGLIDPLTGFPEVSAVYWKDGKTIDLGTFGGNASYANAINNAGQIVGMASNTIPDNYSTGIGLPVFPSAFPVTTQFRAFLWEHGVMQDLGTLGGNSAQALFVNDRGQVAGVSYTNTIANPSTGFPTQDPFFWEDGEMMDIGSFGGTQGSALGLNNRGQVVGSSKLPGDEGLRPFLWGKKEGLRDLGTLGGTIAGAQAVNGTGTVVGISSLLGDQVFHAFLWENGIMTDLGVPPGKESTRALSINASGQVVGESWIGDGSVGPYAGWLWENSGPIVDLNQLVLPGSDVTVRGASFINDRGEIAGEGLLPNGDVHAILLIPDGDCDDACEARVEASHIDPAAVPVRAMTSGLKSNRRARSTRRLPSPNL